MVVKCGLGSLVSRCVTLQELASAELAQELEVFLSHLVKRLVTIFVARKQSFGTLAFPSTVSVKTAF